MKATMPFFSAVLVLSLLSACQEGTTKQSPFAEDTDSDTDVDSDTDTSEDADADSDTETFTDAWGEDDGDEGDDAEDDATAAIDLEKLCEEAPKLTDSEQGLSDSSNSFGFDLLAKVLSRTDAGNVFLSPFSMFVALGMTYNGANGNTETEMHDVLRYGNMTVDEINQDYERLLEIVAGQDEDVVLETADSIWIDIFFKDKVVQDFIDVNQDYFDALVSVLDFHDSSALGAINSWISENTAGKIDEMLDFIPETAVMYLINALYFNATWTYRFEPTETYAGEFNTGGGGVEVETMSIFGDFDYFQNELFQAVQLPYGKGVYAMTVLLPWDDKTVEDLQTQMTEENWDEWRASFYLGEITLELPKFEIMWERVNETDIGMNNTLRDMGIQDAFLWYAADFSGLCSEAETKPYISRVLHNTYIKVDEEGTESAAASLVEISVPVDGDGEGLPVFEMKVDRPFMFVIHDRCNGGILFIGRITDPSLTPQ